MFGISFSEIILTLVLSLIIFGPKQLPQIANIIGSLILNLQQLWFKLKHELSDYTGFNEIKQARLDAISTYQQIKTNIISHNYVANGDDNRLPLYQAELDFDHQPELFD